MTHTPIPEEAVEKARDRLEIDWDGNEPYIRSDSIEAALEAVAPLLALASQGVTKLDWDGDKAECPFGTYTITRTRDGYAAALGDEELVHVGFEAVDYFYGAKRKAQDYAQADFEARVRSCLADKPQSEAGIEALTAERDRLKARVEEMTGLIKRATILVPEAKFNWHYDARSALQGAPNGQE